MKSYQNGSTEEPDEISPRFRFTWLVGIGSVVGVVLGAFVLSRSPGGSAIEAAASSCDRGHGCNIESFFDTLGWKLTEDAKTDYITALPGVTGQPIHQFSGYVNVSATKRSFYILTLSQRDPTQDPLVFWTNGGPGCSGLIGYFTEHGPYRPTEELTLKMNDYSWTKVANMLYIENPAGVGFSYTTEESSNSSDLKAGDLSVAKDNYKLIQEIYRKYPDMMDNDLYLSAESYGGHYIPTLGKLIVDGLEETPVNLKGMAVGNPYTDPVENMRGMFGAFWGHQMLPAPEYHEWLDKCGSEDNEWYYYGDSGCIDLEDAMFDVVGDVDWYGLDFPVCNSNPSSDQTLSAQARQFLKHAHPRLHERLEKRWARQLEIATNQPSEGKKAKEEGYDACITDYMTRFLNKKDVKEAIHARTDITWAECSASILYSFDSQMDYMEPVWNDLLTNHDLRVMIFSGDDDSICAPLGTQSWIWKLGYEVSDAWSAWDYEDPQYGPGQVGGYHVKFNVTNSSKSTLSFVTVHHAGHEVPMYQPMRGFRIFSNFLNGVF